MNEKQILSIDKYLEPVDLIDIYITKNILKIIKNEESLDFIKKNIFLLGITNNNGKNSLVILLDNGKFDFIDELIIYDYTILNYKNTYDNNLLRTLLAYDYFYDRIINYIKKCEYNFAIKIITELNSNGVNFIDSLVGLVNFQENYDDKFNHLQKKILLICKNIYLLDNEKKTLIVTKLCKTIKNENYLFDILKFIDVNNFDIYPDLNMFNCIDYLIISNSINVLEYIIDNANYIEFTNIEDNLIFDFVENSYCDINVKLDIIFKILSKSNISKLKNSKNQNILYLLIKHFEIDIGIDIIIKFANVINIYEQDIYGQSIYKYIKGKYSKNDLHKLKYDLDLNLKKNSKNYKYYIDIEKKINISSKLIKSDIGIFTSNIIHNMLYTIIVLKINSKYLTIPYLKQSKLEKIKNQKLLNMSNNEKNMLGYIKIYFESFNTWLPHLILWRNKNNYWIEPNLIQILKKQKSINFIYIKLSVYMTDDNDTRHSNCIIIDNKNKIVERFEPYGEINYTNSNDINIMIETQIANQLGYKYEFVQPYPGFQSRSDEYGKHNKSYGDPIGYCLAWSFLYIYIKLELFKIRSEINPIDFINWYIINKFEKDFEINPNKNKTNKYILFIRYFSLFLDKQKNKLIESYNMDCSQIYQTNMDKDFYDKIILNINLNLEKYVLNL